jgi:ABC-type sugar transport system permease subunit
MRASTIADVPGAQPKLAPWLFLSPFLLVFLVFTAYPLVQAVVLSLQQTFGPQHTKFVGLRNFQFLFSDPLFWTALQNTVVYSLGSLFVQLPLSLGLALLLETPGLRGGRLYRVILFSPSLVGVSFAAMIFAVILEKRTGLLNVALHRTIGWNLDFAWLEQHVMVALIVASLWMWVGFNMTYFSAALKNVRRDLLEAAEIDGAGPLRRFFHVTIPEISPVAGFVVLLSMIGSFQLFELPYLLLNSTAGPGNRGMTIVLYLYQTGFENSDLGYASAIGWVLGLLLIAMTVFQRLLVRRSEAT